jgi:single-strand DNA-binding protein
MNTIQISGRLTTDPDRRTLPDGTAVCKLRLAVKGMARGRETGYLDVTSFGPGAQAAARELTKGWLVAVTGRLEYREWETSSGSKHHAYEAIGEIEFLAAPREKDTQTEDSEPEAELPVAA